MVIQLHRFMIVIIARPLASLMALVGLVICILLAGCATPGSKMNYLEAGMSKAQVFELLGPPASTSRVANRTFLNYSVAVPIYDGWGSTSIVPHYVVLENGVVTEWGNQNQIQSPVSTTSNQSTHVQDSEVR